MPIHTTTLTGASGEHFVMFRLLQMGYIAGMAPQGAPNADIIVTNVAGTNTVALQVKTRNPIGTDGGWHMKEKHEAIRSPNVFYCFITLQEDINDIPIAYIVPSAIVATVLTETHQIWLATPGINGRIHKQTEMRRLLPDYSEVINSNDSKLQKYATGWLDMYKENWKILGLE